MKISFYFLFFFSIISHSIAQVHIHGEILTDHKFLHLNVLNPQTLEYVSLDSLRIKNKHFEFSAKYEGPNLYQLEFDQKEILYLSVEDTHSIYIKRTPDSMHIEGSPSTLKMRAFRKQNEVLQEKYFGQMKKDLDGAMAAKDSAKVQEIMAQADIVLQQFLTEFRVAISDLGTTPAAYYALQYSDFNKEIDFIQQRLAAFKNEKPNSPITQALEYQVKQTLITGIGKFPPHFETQDIDGQTFQLENLKGKVVLIDFWASWCRACRVENPKFVSIYETYRSEPFEIVSISKDEDFKSYMKALKKDGISAWRHIWDEDQSISNLYSVNSLPQNLLLDQEGKIIAKNVKAEKLVEILSQVLD